jgi:hypothetical protein
MIDGYHSVADRIEKNASKPKDILVRASRFALEEFDVNRIAKQYLDLEAYAIAIIRPPLEKKE